MYQIRKAGIYYGISVLFFDEMGSLKRFILSKVIDYAAALSSGTSFSNLLYKGFVRPTYIYSAY